MEETIFPLPAVAGELKKGYIEARLHTDGGPAVDRNLELQRELTGSVATPIYVLYHPVEARKLKMRAGYMGEDTFLEFLRSVRWTE